MVGPVLHFRCEESARDVHGQKMGPALDLPVRLFDELVKRALERGTTVADIVAHALESYDHERASK